MSHLVDGTILADHEIDYNIIGAGGFVTTGNQSNDGFIICYSDVCGPNYRLPGETQWRQFFRVGDNYPYLPNSLINMEGDVSGGCRVADTNSSVILALLNGVLYRTTDQCETIERLTFPKMPYDGFEGWSFGRGTHVRCDPNNENVWWIGTPENGLAISDDMFDTWDYIDLADIPLPVGPFANVSVAIYSIAFDKFSLSAGKSQRIAVSVPGVGIHLTEDAGATWALITGSPELYCHMEWDTSGYLHVVEYGQAADHLKLYSRWDDVGGWFTATEYDDVLTGIAGVRPIVDPYNPGRIYCPTEGSNVRSSDDYGVNWTGGNGTLDTINLRVADNIPWHAWTNEHYLSHGDMWFDPVVEGRMWLCEGIGVWYADDFPAVQNVITPVTWHESSVGLENMTNNVLMMSPLGALGLACWDRVGLAMPRADIGTFPRTNGPNSYDNAVAATAAGNGGMDWAWDDPTFLVMTAFCYGNEQGGYSTNEGRGWTEFPGSYYTDSGGQNGAGNIIAFNTNVFVWHGYGGDQKIMYTLDRGANWLDMTSFFGANFATGNTYSNSGLYKKCIVKDEYHQNVAYYYNIGDLTGSVTDLASKGVWKIVYDGSTGFTCTRQRTSLIGSWGEDYYNGKLVQYGDGHWFWTAGQAGSHLYETVDNFVTMTVVKGFDDINGDHGLGGDGAGFRSVYGVAVGKEAFPGEPKTVLAIGHRPPDTGVVETNHDYLGMWLCRNFTDPNADREWVRIHQFPGNKTGGFFGNIADVVADPLEYGIWYVAGGRDGVYAHRLLDRRSTNLTGGGSSGEIVDLFGSNLLAWYEAEDLADGAVASWTDKSGNDFHLLQATGGNQPVRSATSFNSLPGVTFDGATDFLAAALSGVAAGTKLQLFMTLNVLSGSETNGRVVSTNSASGEDYNANKYIPLVLKTDVGNIVAFSGDFLGQQPYTESTPAVVTTALSATHSTASFGAATGTPVAFTYPAGYAPTVLTVGGSQTGDNSHVVIGSLFIVTGEIDPADYDAAVAYLETQNGL